jgi:hypothetical protein
MPERLRFEPTPGELPTSVALATSAVPRTHDLVSPAVLPTLGQGSQDDQATGLGSPVDLVISLERLGDLAIDQESQVVLEIRGQECRTNPASVRLDRVWARVIHPLARVDLAVGRFQDRRKE